MIAAAVPMKPFADAKQRLSDVLSGPERQRLVRTMLGDVLAVLRDTPEIGQTYVVTADPQVAGFAARYGAEHIPEDASRGLNGAIGTAAKHFVARGFTTMIVVPGDVPFASPAEIGQLASLVAGKGVGIVPADDMDGTNALLLSPPGAIAPAFGPGSYRRHVAAARATGLDPVTCRLEGLGRDIDLPCDLQDLAHRLDARPEYDFLHAALARTGHKEAESV